MTMAVPMRLEAWAWATRTVIGGSSLHLGEQPFGPHPEHDQGRDVTGQEVPAGVELRADRLGGAENAPPRERPPHAAEPADDDGLETEDQTRRADRRIEVGAHREQHTGD